MGFGIQIQNSLCVAKGIEDQFHAARYAQFVENANHIVAYGVFVQIARGLEVLYRVNAGISSTHNLQGCWGLPST
jgi:hypothetical protein